jgi:hypothetical protein
MFTRCLVALLSTATAAAAADFGIISWNVESGGAYPSVISTQLSELPPATVFALQEVQGRDIVRYGSAIRTAHGGSYRYFAGWTGGSDRLLVVFDEARLSLLEWRELFRHGENSMNDWHHRSPLVCSFEHKASGERFYLVTVHLARGAAQLRRSQSRGLRNWARHVKRPVIAVGTFNFDYDFHTQSGNRSFEMFTRRNTWNWITPEKLIDGHWADRDGNGVDDYPNSCIDFAFTAGLPHHWSIASEVIVRPGDFPEGRASSSHRPLNVTVSIASADASETETPTHAAVQKHTEPR